MTEMTNREMLELAAKAAGITLTPVEVKNVAKQGDDRFIGYLTDSDQWPPGWFDPLTDDGDALRLAVRLNVWPVRVFSPKNHPDTIRVQAGSEYWTEITEEEIFDDPFAATRRAIVRAAAEIGKEKND